MSLQKVLWATSLQKPSGWVKVPLVCQLTHLDPPSSNYLDKNTTKQQFKQANWSEERRKKSSWTTWAETVRIKRRRVWSTYVTAWGTSSKNNEWTAWRDSWEAILFFKGGHKNVHVTNKVELLSRQSPQPQQLIHLFGHSVKTQPTDPLWWLNVHGFGSAWWCSWWSSAEGWVSPVQCRAGVT